MKLKLFLVLLSIIAISCGESEPKILNQKKISKWDLKEKWPLIETEGTLKCVQFEIEGVSPELSKGVLIEIKGTDYPLNGTAKTWSDKYGYSDIEEIWSDDLKLKRDLMKLGVTEKNATSKISIGPLIEEGIKLCE
ncbi:MAG: hypothetical protein RIT22_973 [Bacteroidota bacterium]|jgi:hypothetical protein